MHYPPKKRARETAAFPPRLAGRKLCFSVAVEDTGGLNSAGEYLLTSCPAL